MMDAIDRYEKFSEIVHELEKLVVHPPMPYWFYNDVDAPYPEDMDLCHECLKEVSPDAVFGEDYGGGYEFESDSPAICEKCNKLLAYTLTDYGVDSGLDIYAEYPLITLSPQESYEFLCIAYGISRDDDERIVKIIGITDNWYRSVQEMHDD